MSRLQELMESRTVTKPNYSGPVHILPEEKFDEIEAELLAPLKAENARLKERLELVERPPWMDVIDADPDLQPRADADPMNAMNAHSERIEQPVPLDPFRREWIRETEGILSKHEQRLDKHDGKLDNLNTRIEPREIADLDYHRRIDELAARVDMHQKRIDDVVTRVANVDTYTELRFVPLEKSIAELAARMSHIDTGTDIRITALEAARQPQPTPSTPVVTDKMTSGAIAMFNSLYGKKALRAVLAEILEAAFAARDREDQS